MRYQFSKSDQIAGGKESGRTSLRNKTGIHAIPEDEHRNNSALGGKTQGPIQGAANVASGQWDRIRNSPDAVEARLEWARSDENKMRFSEMGKKQGPNVDWEKIRTTESCRLGAKIGGPIGRTQPVSFEPEAVQSSMLHVPRGKDAWRTFLDGRLHIQG